MAGLGRLVALTILLGAFILSSACAVSITGVGQVTIDANGFTGVKELSGITYVGAVAPNTHRYYVVSDNGSAEGAVPRVYGMDVIYNTATGAVTSAKIVSQHNLAVGHDPEGIAYNTSAGTVYVSDENGTNPQIREYDLSTGAVINTLSVPSVFQNARDNYGLESLTRQWGGASLWTANEEALTVDGSLSSTSTGSIVRLLKYDSNLNPAGQWAYQTDPKGSNIFYPDAPRSGISDMIALPDGAILVLERYLGNNYRSRIYQVDFTGATDMSGLSGLIGADYTRVAKTRLWEQSFDFGDASRNYEGICLGAQLDNDAYSMLMVADYDGAQNLFALKAEGIVFPPPPHPRARVPHRARPGHRAPAAQEAA